MICTLDEAYETTIDWWLSFANFDHRASQYASIIHNALAGLMSNAFIVELRVDDTFENMIFNVQHPIDNSVTYRFIYNIETKNRKTFYDVI